MTQSPRVLLLGYGILFIACGIAPYDRATWWAENDPNGARRVDAFRNLSVVPLQ